MARRYWIGVAHRAQALSAREGGFVAFSHGQEAAVRRTAPGDGVLYYAPKDDFEGTPVQAFVALAEIDDGEVTQRAMAGTEFTPWTRAATFETVAEAPVRPMLDELGFITDKQSWGMAFRRSLFRIDAADFDRIAAAMRGDA